MARRSWTVAVAESLTGGMLSAAVAHGPDASRWFRGGLVAYQPGTKHKLLRVSEGPVVSELCALEMAFGVTTLLDADVGVATTGVGGPEPAEGQEPGTVWVAVVTPRRQLTRLALFGGRDPEEVCSLASELAVRLAAEAVESPVTA